MNQRDPKEIKIRYSKEHDFSYEERIKIGVSDYTRKAMGADDMLAIGTSSKEFLDAIEAYEREGYVVKFETSIWRKLFAMGLYKVVAYR